MQQKRGCEIKIEFKRIETAGCGWNSAAGMHDVLSLTTAAAFWGHYHCLNDQALTLFILPSIQRDLGAAVVGLRLEALAISDDGMLVL